MLFKGCILLWNILLIRTDTGQVSPRFVLYKIVHTPLRKQYMVNKISCNSCNSAKIWMFSAGMDRRTMMKEVRFLFTWRDARRNFTPHDRLMCWQFSFLWAPCIIRGIVLTPTFSHFTSNSLDAVVELENLTGGLKNDVIYRIFAHNLMEPQ